MAYLQGFGPEGDFLRGRFETQWKSTRGYDDTEMAQYVAWGNAQYTPPDPQEPWVRFSVLHSGADQASIGDNPIHRHDGIVQVEVFVPRGQGEGTLDDYCDDAASIFRDYADQQGVRFRSPYTRNVGPQGGWYKRDVLVPFTRDTIFS